MAAAGYVIYMVVVAIHTTWFRLIKNTKKAHYVYQISSQSDEWCQLWEGLIDPPVC